MNEKKLRRYKLRKKIEPWLYLLPFFVSIGIFSIYPVVNVFLMSFKEDYQYLTGAFSQFGFANYEAVASDPYFQQAMANTIKYVFIVVPISLALSLIVANLLNQKIKGVAFFQTAYFLPMVTSTIAVGLAWKYMFNFKSGIINYILGFFGVNPVNWLADPNSNFPALVIYGIWSTMPFTIILLLSGLQNIDPVYNIAAKIDGASSLKIFFRITVPLLMPTICLVLIVNTISAFKVFNELFPLFSGPGVAWNLFTVVYYIYHEFRGLTPPRYGNAAAGAVILFFVIFAFTQLQLALQRYIRRTRGE